MSDVKYIFIDGDDGKMTIYPTKIRIVQGFGWLVEVPLSFQITLDLSNITNALYVYELVLSHPDTTVIETVE